MAARQGHIHASPHAGHDTETGYDEFRGLNRILCPDLSFYEKFNEIYRTYFTKDFRRAASLAQGRFCAEGTSKRRELLSGTRSQQPRSPRSLPKAAERHGSGRRIDRSGPSEVPQQNCRGNGNTPPPIGRNIA